MKIRRLIIIAFLFCIVIQAANSRSYGYWDVTSEAHSDGGGTSVLPWYPVEDWEIDFCSEWGGSRTPDDSLAGTVSGSEPFSVLALTLQAQSDFGVLLDNTTLYEYAFYIQPGQGFVTYTLELLGADGLYSLENGTASATTGAANYKAVYLNSSRYTQIRLSYKGCELCSQPDNLVTAPIVLK